MAPAAQIYNSTFDVDFVDINGDGHLDLIAPGANATAAFTVALGNGDGTFNHRRSFATSANTRAVLLTDVNNDGVLDAIVATSTAGLSVLIGNSNGTFQARQNFGSFAHGGFSLVMSDFDGDGKVDALVSSANAGGQSTLLRGNGDGTFGNQTTFATPADANQLVLGDFNGDSVTDFFAFATVSSAQLFIGNSTDSFYLQPFSLSTRSDALGALTLSQKALTAIAKERGNVGAYQSRLSVSANALTTRSLEYMTAAGRIVDADVATEAAQLLRLTIRQQAAQAVLAQANLQPTLALTLLT